MIQYRNTSHQTMVYHTNNLYRSSHRTYHWKVGKRNVALLSVLRSYIEPAEWHQREVRANTSHRTESSSAQRALQTQRANGHRNKGLRLYEYVLASVFLATCNRFHTSYTDSFLCCSWGWIKTIWMFQKLSLYPACSTPMIPQWPRTAM